MPQVPVEIEDAKYILWQNNGTDGWSPTPFDTLSEIADFIQQGNTHSGFVISKKVALRVLETA